MIETDKEEPDLDIAIVLEHYIVHAFEQLRTVFAAVIEYARRLYTLQGCVRQRALPRDSAFAHPQDLLLAVRAQLPEKQPVTPADTRASRTGFSTSTSFLAENSSDAVCEE